jgi:hypothetical protein
MALFAAAVTALVVLAVGSSLAAATHPALAPVVLLTALALIRYAVPSLAYRRLLVGGIAFIALVTVPTGCLTHGVVSGAYSVSLPPVDADSLTAHFASRTPTDSAAFARGMLLSFPASEQHPAAIAFRQNSRLRWADAFPHGREPGSSTISRFTDLTLTPLLWRVRVDGLVRGPDAPGWLYVWRWGGTQRLYVFDDSERLPSG